MISVLKMWNFAKNAILKITHSKQNLSFRRKKLTFAVKIPMKNYLSKSRSESSGKSLTLRELGSQLVSPKANEPM